MSKKLYFLITFVLVLTLSGVVQAEPCDVNLMGWWKFDEGDGNTVADSSAYNNNGVSVSLTPSWVGGSPIDPCDSAMDFDGEGDGEGGLMDYVVCAERDGKNPGTYPAELMPDTFTISCWVKLYNFTWYGAFISNGTDGACGFFLHHGGLADEGEPATNNFGLSMFSEGGAAEWWDVETPAIYDTDRWYHLAATYDGQYATVYVDGDVAAGPEYIDGPMRWISADSNDHPGNFVIGSWKDETWPEGDLPIDGIIDDVRFYNYALDTNDISLLAGYVPGAATNPSPFWDAEDVSLYTNLSWTPGTDSNSHDVYFGTSESEVTDANIDVNFGVYMGRQDANDFSNSNLVPALELDKTYYWRIDEVNETASTLIKGNVWSFRTTGSAYNVYPADRAWDIPALNLLLRWTAGTGAGGHDVYFGSDEAAVEDANTSNTALYPGIYRGPTQALADVNYPVEDLEVDSTYYWRIDEVNAVSATFVKGDVWRFTTGVFLNVDSFERYADDAAIEAVWDTSHFGNNLADLFIEKRPDYVIDGNSMMFTYMTYKTAGQLRGSEAVATLPLEVGTNWTKGGAKALVLYFYGDPINGTDHDSGYVYSISQDQMYVALEDGSTNVGVVKYDKKYNYDMNDIKKAEWQEWDIDLADPCLADVNVANVAKIYIGFGGQKTGQTAAGAGEKSVADTVWFDDIELWPPWCRTEFVATDFTGDCNTDFADVLVMSDDWLASDASIIIVPTPPNDANLVGWWKFDEGAGNTVTDSSSYNNNGATVSPTPSWVGGHPNDPCDSAMSFDGANDYYNVVCAERVGSGPGDYPAELRPDTFTIACWTKLDIFGYYSGFVSNGIDGGCGFFLGNVEGDTTDEGTFILSMMTESGGWMDIETNTYVIDMWYHLAFSYDGQYANFYVDGVLAEGPADFGGPMRWIDTGTSDYPDQFVIGSWEDPVSEWSEQIDGTIDEVRFYNYALQSGEIAVLAGLPAGSIYVPLDVPTNLVPKDPCDSADPNLGTGAFDPNNMDIVNFRDFAVMAGHWLEQQLWPAP